MAKISGGSDEKVFRIQSFLGLNESPDGDTKLKLGEAAAMRNFKVTRDKSLQKRPGMESQGYVSIYYSNYNNENDILETRTTEPYISASTDITQDKRTGELLPSGEMVTVNYSDYATSKYQLQDGWYNLNHDSVYFSFFPDGSCVELRRVLYDQESGTYVWRGVHRVVTETTYPVRCLWSGFVGGKERIVGITRRRAVEIYNGEEFTFRFFAQTITINDDDYVSMFGFNDNLYILSCSDTKMRYFCWDGVEDELNYVVQAYDPVVAVSIPGMSSGESNLFGYTLERVNLLTNGRRVWLSPSASDGMKYFLPEDVGQINYVKSLITGEYVDPSFWSTGTWTGATMDGIFGIPRDTTFVFFSSSNDEAKAFLEAHYGTNTIEVGYQAKTPSTYGLINLFPNPGKVYAEQFNGPTDSRVFLCCENSNQVYYSGIDNNGQPRADYFPDMNVITVGDTSDHVTGMIRHYSRLIIYKKNATYSVQYGTISLADGTTTAAFYCTPINKRIGNEAFGQVQLVLNSPRTLHGKDLYEWKNNSSYSSNLTIDERQARRISDRIYKTLATFDFSQCYCYDDNDHQEYYICYDKKALVHNYAVDAWYYYDNFDVTCMVNFRGNLYAGDSQGRFNLVSRANRTDNGEEITGYWESGAEPFDREFMRKYSSMLWLTLKPELRSKVQVTVETDRKSDHAKKTAASSLFTFSDADFRQWSFNTNRKPHITRLKIKAKKFAYYKLILSFSGENTTATVVAADMRIRYTGYAK